MAPFVKTLPSYIKETSIHYAFCISRYHLSHWRMFPGPQTFFFDQHTVKEPSSETLLSKPNYHQHSITFHSGTAIANNQENINCLYSLESI